MQRTNHLLEKSVAVIQKYNRNDLDVETSLLNTLNLAINSFSETNDLAKVSQLESLKAEFATSQRGINPYTLAKATEGRRGLRKMVAFKILQDVGTMLRENLRRIETQLKEARQMIEQIILTAVQTGSLTADQIEQSVSSEALETIWSGLGNEPALSVAQKKVLLSISIHDVVIMLGEIFDTLRHPTPPSTP